MTHLLWASKGAKKTTVSPSHNRFPVPFLNNLSPNLPYCQHKSYRHKALFPIYEGTYWRIFGFLVFFSSFCLLKTIEGPGWSGAVLSIIAKNQVQFK
jgi:hypothetical protein